MRIRATRGLALLLGILALGCCDECEQTACPDAVPPNAVTDLRATDPGDSSVTLTWTAPGDDGDEGTAAAYDIRYAAGEQVGVAWWDSLATSLTSPPVPRAAGTIESLTIGALVPDSTYTFALKTADDVPNWSGLSNTLIAQAGGPSGPILSVQPTSLDFGSAATALEIIITNAGSDTLRWTASAVETWMSISPQSGETTTEEDTLIATVDRTALAIGDYAGTIDVTAETMVQIAAHLRVIAAEVNGMILVPAGGFIMGDGVAGFGADEHTVTLTHDFLLGQHEVTNAEYLAALQWAYDHGHVTATPSEVRDNLDGGDELLLDLASEYCEIQFADDTFSLRASPSSAAQSAYPEGYDPSGHPVKTVTWFGAIRYCDWLSLQAGLERAHDGNGWCNEGDPYGAVGYRLPTDAEWEYAAQFDNERIYPWGDEAPDLTLANFAHQLLSRGWTTPVGTFPAVPVHLGLADMAGNVWEWCYDIFYPSLGIAPATDPVIDSETGGPRVVRGGGWSDGETALRCAHRAYMSGSGRTVGFRVARTVQGGMR